MNYGTLQTAVNSTLGGRTDLPAHVYEIALSEINRDCRTLDMQATTTLSASSEEVALPSDFLEVVAAYIDSGGFRNALEPYTPNALNFRRNDTERPVRYSIVDGYMKLQPAPDGTYSIELRYYQENSALSDDSDTNDVLTQYPDLYLYCVLKHAAAWMQDPEQMTWFGTLHADAYRKMESAELSRTLSGPMIKRSHYDISRNR